MVENTSYNVSEAFDLTDFANLVEDKNKIHLDECDVEFADMAKPDPVQASSTCEEKSSSDKGLIIKHGRELLFENAKCM